MDKYIDRLQAPLKTAKNGFTDDSEKHIIKTRRITKMKYNLYKTNGYVKINAYLEETETATNITFQKILNQNFAVYTPITILVPEEFYPIVENPDPATAYLELDFPKNTATDNPHPERIPVENIGNRQYGYIDYCNLDENLNKTGKTIRIRIPIKFQ